MDNNKIYQGWIYCIRNKINGKMYIGKTNNFEKRQQQHFNLRREGCPVLKAALRKYGINNFEMYPILTFTAINKKVLNTVLNYLETFYIKKYNTFGNGYNLTEGGEGICGYEHSAQTRAKMSRSAIGSIPSKETRQRMREASLRTQNWTVSEKPILQYDLDGNFIQEFKSISSAARGIGKQIAGSISYAACHENTKAGGYMWRFKNENVQRKINPYIPQITRGKPVYHFSKDGILLGSYRSPKEASKATGIKLQNISASLMRTDLKSIHRKDWWSYNSIPEKEKEIERKPVYLYSKDGMFITSYKSVKQAHESTGASFKTIHSSISRVHKTNKHQCNYWSYNSPEERGASQ